jgi:hypothetical protein
MKNYYEKMVEEVDQNLLGKSIKNQNLGYVVYNIM